LLPCKIIDVALNRNFLKLSAISLYIEGYDDLFSDFDPRGYAQRALSVDFLDEAKRASRDKPTGGIELKLMIDSKKRRKKDETGIKKRLRNHFSKHYKMLKSEKQNIVKRGSLFVLLGIIVMLFSTLIIFSDDASFLKTFLVVISEPAGWFLFWEGLNIVLFESKKAVPDLKFYEKMAKCNVEFISC
jgi:hypothetical protein